MIGKAAKQITLGVWRGTLGEGRFGFRVISFLQVSLVVARLAVEWPNTVSQGEISNFPLVPALLLSLLLIFLNFCLSKSKWAGKKCEGTYLKSKVGHRKIAKTAKTFKVIKFKIFLRKTGPGKGRRRFFFKKKNWIILLVLNEKGVPTCVTF